MRGAYLNASTHRMFPIVLATIGVLVVGCLRSDGQSGGLAGIFGGPRVTVPAGAEISVRLAQSLSSETAHSGDSWEGVVTRPVTVGDRVVIPAGAEVQGVVVSAREAQRGSRASLELGVRAVKVEDRKVALRASAEPVIAGSTRARNVGAIAGGVVAGALLGKATADEAGKGAIIGGAVATGAVAASKGYQVVLHDGTVMTFAVNEKVSMRV